MSVCIAASCFEEEKPRIVLCRDWKGEIAGVGSTETIMKRRSLSRDWVALLADSITRSEELCVRYQYHLENNEFTEKNIADEVRKVFHDYKKALADSHLKSVYGISFDHLINRGKESIGETFTNQCLDDISRLTVNAQLIIAGFVEGYDPLERRREKEPMICTVSEQNEGDPVTFDEEFSAIGGGHTIARAMLCIREQEVEDSLMETIYAVFEAKIMSEKVPGIGPSLTIEIFYPDGQLMTLSDAGFDRCKELFARFGPRSRGRKSKVDWFKMEQGYLELSADPVVPWAAQDEMEKQSKKG